jgi:hypothetical protein
MAEDHEHQEEKRVSGVWIRAIQEKWPYTGIVNLFALMQYQCKGETVSPLYFLQAARTGVVISCQA